MSERNTPAIERAVCRGCLHTEMLPSRQPWYCPVCGDDDSALVVVTARYGGVWLRGQRVDQ